MNSIIINVSLNTNRSQIFEIIIRIYRYSVCKWHTVEHKANFVASYETWEHYHISRLPYSREFSQQSRYSFTRSKFGNDLPRCVIKLNKVNCKWKHYTWLSFRNRCQKFQSMCNVHRFFPSSIITRDHYIMLGTWRVAYMLRRVLEAGPNASKIWRGKKGSFTRSIHRHTRPIIGGNAVFGFASPLTPLSSFFSLRISSPSVCTKHVIKVYCRRYVMTGLVLARN